MPSTHQKVSSQVINEQKAYLRGIKAKKKNAAQTGCPYSNANLKQLWIKGWDDRAKQEQKMQDGPMK
jgi:ribosome modulation factor